VITGSWFMGNTVILYRAKFRD